MQRTNYTRLLAGLHRRPGVWLVTGAAGFIGSNLVETLLRHGQRVVGLDDFSTGRAENLAEVRRLVSADSRRRFRMIRGDIRRLADCRRACRGVHYVLHQAAMGSVPRSIDEPLAAHEANVTGTVNVLLAARDAGVRRVVYASSSAVYGDGPDLPKVEGRIGRALSPYAVTKHVDELYAEVFGRCYGLETVGLRYFNVFGPRQDPNGAYAAVIPRWIEAMMRGQPVHINGDGRTSRDFCYVANVVQANLLAARVCRPGVVGRVFNVALGERTTLQELFELLRSRLEPFHPHLQGFQPVRRPFRPGDIRHSLAEVAAARRLLGYRPTHDVASGLEAALAWYREHLV